MGGGGGGPGFCANVMDSACAVMWQAHGTLVIVQDVQSACLLLEPRAPSWSVRSRVYGCCGKDGAAGSLGVGIQDHELSSAVAASGGGVRSVQDDQSSFDCMEARSVFACCSRDGAAGWLAVDVQEDELSSVVAPPEDGVRSVQMHQSAFGCTEAGTGTVPGGARSNSMSHMWVTATFVLT